MHESEIQSQSMNDFNIGFEQLNIIHKEIIYSVVLIYYVNMLRINKQLVNK